MLPARRRGDTATKPPCPRGRGVRRGPHCGADGTGQPQFRLRRPARQRGRRRPTYRRGGQYYKNKNFRLPHIIENAASLRDFIDESGWPRENFTQPFVSAAERFAMDGISCVTIVVLNALSRLRVVRGSPRRTARNTWKAARSRAAGPAIGGRCWTGSRSCLRGRAAQAGRGRQAAPQYLRRW